MVGRVVVIGLGPGDPSLLSAAALSAIDRISERYLRTARHPSAAALGAAISFDDVYEAATTLAEVYPAIVEELVGAAGEAGEILYAVPGSPFVAERTVELLRADGRVSVEIVPSLSFLDLAWGRLGVDPLAVGARLVDGHRFNVEAAGHSGPMLVGQCDTRLVLSEIKLSLPDGGVEITVLQRLGQSDELVSVVTGDDLDRVIEPDHLTCLWIREPALSVARELVRFDELVHTLRSRCPWDRAQTHDSLTRHLLEETYEVLEAIDGLGPDYRGADHLEEELGDLLFQIYFHATLAEEEGLFTLADVARGVHDKLVLRHPHVFGTVQADTPDQVMTNWEEIKQREKGRTSVMEGIPGHLPSLLYAHKVQRKAASVGFDWDGVAGAWPKIAEEAAELHDAMQLPASGQPAHAVVEELGDLLFAVVNVARHLEVDPDAALRAATGKFRARFEGVEALAAARGLDLRTLDLAALDGLWDEVKRSS
ncbi:MAG TPA: nucleoside triphosphate pyrophosphohydrolase [Acidimicrobiales bacterium]|jgi:tetrapyrrole methylase family protein/MazG family protein